MEGVEVSYLVGRGTTLKLVLDPPLSIDPAAVASSAYHTCVEPPLLKMLIKGTVATANMAMANKSP